MSATIEIRQRRQQKQHEVLGLTNKIKGLIEMLGLKLGWNTSSFYHHMLNILGIMSVQRCCTGVCCSENMGLSWFGLDLTFVGPGIKLHHLHICVWMIFIRACSFYLLLITDIPIHTCCRHMWVPFYIKISVSGFIALSVDCKCHHCMLVTWNVP